MSAGTKVDSPWQSARWHSDVVSIPSTSRKMSVTVAGRARTKPTQPLIIIAAGLGGVAAEHILVAQLLAPFARVMRFDRAGYGSSVRSASDNSPDTYTMASGVRDLVAVLEATSLGPPYILVGQSFGGVFIREFLSQQGCRNVAGLVLVDSNPYLQPDVVLDVDEILRNLCGEEAGGMAYEDINGLNANVVLTPEQIDAVGRDAEVAVKNGTIAGEAAAADQSVKAVNRAQGIRVTEDADGNVLDIGFTAKPLGKGRLSVVVGDFPKDFEKALEFGKANGHGNKEVRHRAEIILAKAKRTWFPFQEAQGGLTEGEVRVRKGVGSGATHNLHMTRPDVVADEVRWVLEGFKTARDDA